MITKFKIFENVNECKPEVGDYVIYDDSKKVYMNNPNLAYPDTHILVFLSDKIGRITNIREFSNSMYADIKYDEQFPKRFKTIYFDNTYDVKINDIICWSKNKEDLEAIIAANKFNI